MSSRGNQSLLWFFVAIQFTVGFNINEILNFKPSSLPDIHHLNSHFEDIRNDANSFMDEHIKADEVVITEEDFDSIGSLDSLDDLINKLGLQPELHLREQHLPMEPPSTSSVIASTRGFNPISFSTPASDKAYKHYSSSGDRNFESTFAAPRANTIQDQSRSGQSARYIKSPERAGCIPEPRTVELPLEAAAGTTFFPTCIRLNRCGGCCQNKELRSCQPIATEEVIVNVVKIEKRQSNLSQERRSTRSPQRQRGRARAGRSRGRRGNRLTVGYSYVNVSMEEHTSCDCQCLKTEADCTALQRYDAPLCECVCKNNDEEKKCQEKRSTHFWRNCKCHCIDVPTCSSVGDQNQYDMNTCQCLSLRGASWGDVFARKSTNLFSSIPWV